MGFPPFIGRHACFLCHEQEGDGRLVLTGGHDVDQGWIGKVLKNSTIHAAKTCEVDEAGQCEEEEDEDDENDSGPVLSTAKIIPRGEWWGAWVDGLLTPQSVVMIGAGL